MKIFYDLHSLQYPRTGISYYTQHLIEGMLSSPGVEEVAGIIGSKIWRHEALRNILASDAPGPSKAMTSHWKMKLRQTLRSVPGLYELRSAMRNLSVQATTKKLQKEHYIYHETNYIPSTYSGKLVITVHDLSHRRHPEFHPAERVNYINSKLPRALSRADRIITDSLFSAEELKYYYDIPYEKIVAIHLGVDPCFKKFSDKEITEVLQAYQLRPRGYVLSICTLEPRKNLSRLIQAFSNLPKLMRKEYPLVLIGIKGWKNDELKSMLIPLIEAKEALLPGYIPRHDLLKIYSGAACFAYPSLYEGFGLPVAEAMSSGVPVLTSNIGALKEIFADAAVAVDPYSIDEITSALMTLLTDGALASNLIERGLTRANELRWNRCIERTAEVYRSLYF